MNPVGLKNNANISGTQESWNALLSRCSQILKRTPDNDTSGDYLAESLQAEGHKLSHRQIVKDDKYVLRAEFSALIIDEEVDIIISTGSTGLTGRDLAPEALELLFDKAIDG